MEYGNKPTVITRRIIQSDDNRLGQNGTESVVYLVNLSNNNAYLASQMWLLGRLLPFLFGTRK